MTFVGRKIESLEEQLEADGILQGILKKHGVDVEMWMLAVKDGTRGRYTRIREEAVYALRTVMKLSYPEIAAVIGVDSHSACVAAFERYKRRNRINENREQLKEGRGGTDIEVDGRSDGDGASVPGAVGPGTGADVVGGGTVSPATSGRGGEG